MGKADATNTAASLLEPADGANVFATELSQVVLDGPCFRLTFASLALPAGFVVTMPIDAVIAMLRRLVGHNLEHADAYLSLAQARDDIPHTIN